MKPLNYVESEPLVRRKFIDASGKFAGKRATVKYLKKNNKNTWKYLCETYDIDESVEQLYLSELCYRIAFDINEAPRCPVCNKPIPYTSDHPYRQMFCSKTCRTSPDGERICKELREKTIQERYGVDSYSKTEEFKKRSKETMQEKYGVDHYSKTPEYLERVKKTNLEKYGSEWYTNTNEYKERLYNTSMEKYKTPYPSQSSIVKNKVKSTCQEKYGFDSFVESEEYKKVMTERYGVDNYSKLSNKQNKTDEL